jgi:hypothetical protein
MSIQPGSRSSFRETVLILLGATVILGGTLVVLVGIGGIYLLLTLFLVGGLHYLVWGRSMSEEAGVEREEEEALAEPEDWPRDGPHGPSRY